MKPPTEEEINQEIDDGYGLQFEGEPSWLIQTEIDLKEAELDALELTAEMVADRWKKEEEFLQVMVRHYELTVELEMEWQDEVDPVAVAAGQDHLQKAKEKLAKEEEEYQEGKRKSDQAIDLKNRELAVLRDVLRRANNGHF